MAFKSLNHSEEIIVSQDDPHRTGLTILMTAQRGKGIALLSHLTPDKTHKGLMPQVSVR